MQNSIFIKYLFIFSILLNIFFLSIIPNSKYIKIFQKIKLVEESGKKYIDPNIPFRFRAMIINRDIDKRCMRGGGKLIQTTIDYEKKFVYSTFQCKKDNFIEEMNIALSLYHDNFNVYIATKNRDSNLSIGKIAPVNRNDMGI